MTKCFRAAILLIPVLLVPSAVALVRPAVALAQGSPEGESHFNSGLIHLREGRVDMAVKEFERAVKSDSKNPYFRKGLGQAYAGRGDFKDAIKQFREALELNPYYVDVRNDLGTALILAGNREEGKREFLTAYADATNPTPEVSARNLGQAYLDEKNYPEAINWFRTAIGRAPAYPDPYLGLAAALMATDRLDEAVILLESGVEAAPAPGLYLAVGQAYFKAGRFAEARSSLEEAMRKDPSGPVGQAAAQQLQSLPH
ncbi:MAG: tetratricopeptide repeat protein [Acidobacteria bacterium]|jgi:tetratricopeptide (TPR) repeat protein|nr:tetratricopeptide repeat protein [Acidobacteriota bacterium]